MNDDLIRTGIFAFKDYARHHGVGKPSRVAEAEENEFPFNPLGVACFWEGEIRHAIKVNHRYPDEFKEIVRQLREWAAS